MLAVLGALLALGVASCAGAEALCVVVVSDGAGASAIGGEIVATGGGVVTAGAGVGATGGGVVAIGVGEALVAAGVGAVDSRFAAGAGRFGGSRLASFFAGSLAFGLAGCGRDSAATGGAVVSFVASASVVVESPLVLVAALLALDVTGVALALTSFAALSGDDVKRSSTNTPPITVTVITVNPIPKWLLTRSSCRVCDAHWTGWGGMWLRGPRWKREAPTTRVRAAYSMETGAELRPSRPEKFPP